MGADQSRAFVRILGLLESVKRSRNQCMALCPSHPDTRQSLSVSQGDDGRVLIHCMAGCTRDPTLGDFVVGTLIW